MVDNNLVNFKINSKDLDELVSKKNAISVNKNTVLLSNKGKNAVLSAVVNNEGTIKYFFPQGKVKLKTQVQCLQTQVILKEDT